MLIALTQMSVKTFEVIRNVAQLLNMHFPICKRNKEEIEKALKHYKSVYFLQATYLANLQSC